MVWAGISIDECMDLHIMQNGNFLTQWYANLILRPYASAIGDFFLLNVY